MTGSGGFSHPLDRLIARSLGGSVPRLLALIALVTGALALVFTPREEEPQIVVPMVDVTIEAPGLEPRQVERQVAIPVEKLLAQIPGVEHVYSTTTAGRTVVTLAFYVGEDRETALFNSYNKLYSNQHQVPAVVSRWQLRPVEVDDVAILMLGLWSSEPERYSDYELRRLAEEISASLQALPDTGEVNVSGGRPRQVQVLLDPESLAARQTTALDVLRALPGSNVLQSAGNWVLDNRSIALEVGDALRDRSSLEALVVNVVDGVPVSLREVAQVVDGPAEADSYTWLSFAGSTAAGSGGGNFPMVALSVAKQAGSNAVQVAADVRALLAQLERTLLPPAIHVEILRDYGETANEKVNNLVGSLGFAVLTVVVFISLFLGWRPAVVVGLAVPVCYGLTLALDYAFGYTINRVTLFALILSLGLLVDDPITGVDNITRFLPGDRQGLPRRIVEAMAEIRVPLLMSTVTIVLAFLPLAFITGMMGPYMAPMAFNVPVAVVGSTLVAFLITPWVASRLLQPDTGDDGTGGGWQDSLYARWMQPVLAGRRTRWVVVAVVLMFLAAASLPLLRLVPLKLLPYDNKNELQVLVDMPESAALEQTAALTGEVVSAVLRLPEVLAVAAFVGEPSPVDFNGMVRGYYRRHGAFMADLRLKLVDKGERDAQSHGVALRLRALLEPLARDGVSLKVIEVPPGPPVMSTLVAEVYGDTYTPYAAQQQAARTLARRLEREAHVVEVDTTVQAPRERWRFVTDKTKAALSGVATRDLADTLALASAGVVAGHLQEQRETQPLPIVLRLAPAERAQRNDLERLLLKGRAGIAQATTAQGLDAAPRPLVAVGELGHFEEGLAEQSIHRKDLRAVAYVFAELSGRTPAEVIADVVADRDGAGSGQPSGWRSRTYLAPGAGDPWSVPDDIEVRWTGEGEWRITVDVFRDMGLAFAFALVAIYGVLRFQTGSVALSLIIMSAIPLTVIGIMPGFWLLNVVAGGAVAGAPDPVLFTATAMIGMIALAGIVVRNSLILVEFVTQARAAGASVTEALLQAGAVRMRPVLLTAGTTLLGNLVIILDPVFSGLALAIIFGILASTLLSLVVVPVVYLLVYQERDERQVPGGRQ